MREEPEDGREPGEVGRRAAQDTAGELARMGIDPQLLGLEPPPPEPSPAGPYEPGTGSLPGPTGWPGPAGPGVRQHGPGLVARPGSGPPHPVSGAGASWWSSRGSEGGWPPAADPWLDTATDLSDEATPAPGGWAPQPAPGGWAPQPAPGGWAPNGGASPTATPPGGWPLPAQPPAGPPPAGSSVGWSAATEPQPSLASTLRRPLAFPRDSQPIGPPRTPAEAWEAERRTILAEERQGIVVPSGWRRAVRAATFGLLAPGAAAAVERERELVARVRARRREPWVIAFVAGTGGAGTTSTAAGTGLTLAALRTDGILVFDARSGTASLGRRLGGPTAPSAAELRGDTRPGAEPPLPLSLRSGLHVVDGAPWHAPVPPDRLGEVIGQMRERYSITLLDVGNDATEAGQAALARADQVIVVSAARRDAVDGVRNALGRIHHADPYLVTTATVVLVQLSSGGYRRAVEVLQAELGISGDRLVVVPYDPVLAAGEQVEPWRLRTGTREAYLRTAAAAADPVRLGMAPASRGEPAVAW